MQQPPRVCAISLLRTHTHTHTPARSTGAPRKCAIRLLRTHTHTHTHTHSRKKLGRPHTDATIGDLPHELRTLSFPNKGQTHSAGTVSGKNETPTYLPLLPPVFVFVPPRVHSANPPLSFLQNSGIETIFPLPAHSLQKQMVYVLTMSELRICWGTPYFPPHSGQEKTVIRCARFAVCLQLFQSRITPNQLAKKRVLCSKKRPEEETYKPLFRDATHKLTPEASISSIPQLSIQAPIQEFDSIQAPIHVSPSAHTSHTVVGIQLVHVVDQPLPVKEIVPSEPRERCDMPCVSMCVCVCVMCVCMCVCVCVCVCVRALASANKRS